jgi:hypothetical protein
VGGHEVDTSTDRKTFTRECGGAGPLGRKIEAHAEFSSAARWITRWSPAASEAVVEVGPERTFSLLKLAHDAPESRLWIQQPLQLSV